MRKGREREKIKQNRSDEFLPDRNKKFKKSKNTIMASFQAKRGWERPRKREKKKIIVPMSSYPTQNRKFQKNSKKIQKIRKQHRSFFSS